MDAATPEGRSFKQRFPELRVVRPVEFLKELEARKLPGLDAEPAHEPQEDDSESES